MNFSSLPVEVHKKTYKSVDSVVNEVIKQFSQAMGYDNCRVPSFIERFFYTGKENWIFSEFDPDYWLTYSHFRYDKIATWSNYVLDISIILRHRDDGYYFDIYRKYEYLQTETISKNDLVEALHQLFKRCV